MYNFIDIMEKLKNKLNISSDSQIAEKLGINRSNFGERKKRNSIPYENLVILCKKEKISLDFILNNEKDSMYSNNFKELLINSINILNEKECKYYYHLVESEKAKKEIYV